MDVYKEYLYQMSKIEYQTPYLLLSLHYPPPLLKKYISVILKIPFDVDDSTQYYGEIMKICTGYLSYCSTYLKEAKKHIERCKQALTYSELMESFNKTVEIHKKYHQEVCQEFRPINSEREQNQLDEIISLHDSYMNELLDFGKKIAFEYKGGDLLTFGKDHFEIYGERFHQMGEYTDVCMATLIAERLDFIRISLNDIRDRMEKNLKNFKWENYKQLNGLFQEMYDRNRESLRILRQKDWPTRSTLEIQREIDILREKIKHFGTTETFARLTSEISFWRKSTEEFEEIACVITEVKKELKQAKKNAKLYETYNETDRPAHETTSCSCRICKIENHEQYIEYLENTYVEACMPLLTFFACDGNIRIYYQDAIGTYYIDEYGHKIYVAEFYNKVYHIDCEGKFHEDHTKEKYYFDDLGRYIIENGMKIYQLAPCTLKHRLNNQGLFENLNTCHCKHDCRDKMCHPTEIDMNEIVPNVEPVSKKHTLDTKSAKFLWDSIGHILPEILCELEKTRSRNPIHYLAHLLMTSKVKSNAENEKQRKEAEEYRENILSGRQEAAKTAFIDWKAKLPKCSQYLDRDVTMPEYVAPAQNVTDLVCDIGELF